MSINRGMDKEDTHTMEYYLAKKNKIMLFAATRTDLEIILNRVKADRERQISYYIPHMGHLLKKKRNN